MTTEAENTDHLYDFSSMPLTVEQEILATLKRIEVLLTPQVAAQYIPAPADQQANKQPGGITRVVNKARGK